MSVLLATEGTYPFYSGGVSTWCHRLTHGLPQVDFRVLAVATSPYPQAKYDLASNVKAVIKVPQWGLLQPAEYSHHQAAWLVLRNLCDTTPSVIRMRFQPPFERLMALVLSSEHDPEEMGQVLLDLHRYFQRYDYQKSMNSPEAWQVLQHAVRASWEDRPAETEQPSLAEVKQAYQLLYHLLIVLHAAVPRCEITHSSAASFCGLPCVLQKIEHGTPYLLTEHGVYLREQYLNLRRQMRSFFVRWFLLRLIESLVRLNYHFADQVSPVCFYNARWETHLGVPAERIKVIFNGVDPGKFRRCGRSPENRLVVSNLGLIYSLKGQLDLIDAAGILKGRFPELEFRFYGAASDPDYFNRCLQRVSELGLERQVVFAGPTKEPWKAYSEADVMAFPSISEGFPYAVLEAMMCGAAVGATDVGGVSEGLGDCGLLVPSRSPQAMADAIAFLLENREERERLGRRAQVRALENFTEQQFLDAYHSTYKGLRWGMPQAVPRRTAHRG
jgi:glycosyltransferase involved in cell wall biosynthesis